MVRVSLFGQARKNRRPPHVAGHGPIMLMCKMAQPAQLAFARARIAPEKIEEMRISEGALAAFFDAAADESYEAQPFGGGPFHRVTSDRSPSLSISPPGGATR